MAILVCQHLKKNNPFITSGHLGTRSEVCNAGHGLSVWNGVVLGGCSVRGDDLQELPVTFVQHTCGGDGGGRRLHEESRQTE